MQATATPAGAAALGLGARAVAADGDPPMAAGSLQTVLTGGGNLELDEYAVIDPSVAAVSVNADAAFWKLHFFDDHQFSVLCNALTQNLNPSFPA